MVGSFSSKDSVLTDKQGGFSTENSEALTRSVDGGVTASSGR